MSSEAADRLRQALEEKRRELDTHAQQKATQVKAQQEEREQLAQQLASVVRPVFVEAVAIFKDKGFFVQLLEELKPRQSHIAPRLALVAKDPTRQSEVVLSVSTHPSNSMRDGVYFSIHRKGGSTEDPWEPVALGDVNADLVWSWVERFGARIP